MGEVAIHPNLKADEARAHLSACVAICKELQALGYTVRIDGDKSSYVAPAVASLSISKLYRL